MLRSRLPSLGHSQHTGASYAYELPPSALTVRQEVPAEHRCWASLQSGGLIARPELSQKVDTIRAF